MKVEKLKSYFVDLKTAMVNTLYININVILVLLLHYLLHYYYISMIFTSQRPWENHSPKILVCSRIWKSIIRHKTLKAEFICFDLCYSSLNKSYKILKFITKFSQFWWSCFLALLISGFTHNIKVYCFPYV